MTRTPSVSMIWMLPALALLFTVSCAHNAASRGGDAAAVADSVAPGQFIVEPPTLICLGFEWKIRGDANRDAAVAVTYRKRGESRWNGALPLLRIGGETINFRQYSGLDHEYVTEHMFAGSIFDLEPDTEYECRLVMSDPDGVDGESTRQVVVRTRAEPKAFEGGRKLHAYPPGYKGVKEKPAFTGMLDAYEKAEPGDIVLMHAGTYKSERFKYAEPLGGTFHGTYVMTRSGTPERPIVIRPAGDGEVVFDGNGAYRLFDVMAASNLYFEGFTIRNIDVAFYAGLQRVLGCSGLTVKNCRLENIGVGVMTSYAGSKNFYIADNIFIGRVDPWKAEDKYDDHRVSSPVKSYQGVLVYGQGHVVCHNYFTRFNDALDVDTYGPPEEPQDLKPVAIDFYNNDIHEMNDDFMESDGGAHNIRLLRNRCVNAGTCGLSAQPVYGGPAYFIRNFLYNVPHGVAFKWSVNPSGLVAYHNTICTEWRLGGGAGNVHVLNNLFLGTDRVELGNKLRPVLGFGTFTSYSVMDYNGWRPNRGGDNATQFNWDFPTIPGWQGSKHKIVKAATLEELREQAGIEKHGRIVDYDIFEGLAKPDPAQMPNKLYYAKDLNYRLKAGASAVDGGTVLPNINDHFAGEAPDLGALELGSPMPIYGPRTQKAPDMGSDGPP